MTCRLCLRIDNAEVINIFDEIGIGLNVAEILEKHFHLGNDDPMPTAICNTCWSKVLDFHNFYLSVEEAHRLFAVRISIKTENINEQRKNSVNEVVVIASPSLLNNVPKYEPHEEEKDKIKLRFSLPYVEICEKSKHIEVECFDDEIFMDDILSNDNEYEDSVNEKDALDFVIKEEEVAEQCPMRRSTRSSTKTNSRKYKETENPLKHNTGIIKLNDLQNDMVSSKKRSGRPPAQSKSVYTKPTTKIELLKTSTSESHIRRDSNDTYKTKMKEIDNKISQYMRLTCDICAIDQPTFVKLRRHMEEFHNMNKGYAMCCNKKFYRRVLLVDHVDKHLNPDRFKCNECNKVFADKQCMRNHILSKHQPDEVKTFECQHCPHKFTKFYLLQQHRVKHEDKTHICNECNKGFTAGYLLTAHIKLAHANEGIMCDICAKVLQGRTAFNKHQLEHSGITQPKVQCEKCGSWHKDKYALIRHKKRHNEEGVLHVCNLCGKVSPNRGALMAHQRYVHKAERSFKCTVCEKAFKKAKALKEHMASHTGEVLYKCLHCTRTFNSNANMHSHRKKVHPKEFEEARKRRRENVLNPDYNNK